ncbi:hypothetical protein F9B74_01525 [Pelistega sp. NLN82]|uniref:Chemotaxis protein n=1 Tax=Pelistega ratti TaxID=2652177 RepID=A0A6L9Y3L3_9BURK|nr:hypothetical protein [Pelistega ratti]NEN75010.1 hypothetical protein [Pelistega ratti]
MAIPLVIGVALGAAGIYKGAKAVMDNNDAKDLDDSAKSIVRRAESALEASKEKTQKSLSELGEKKVYNLQERIEPFIQHFQKIKNIDLTSPVLSNMTVNEFSNVVIGELQSQVDFVTSAGLGVAGGATGGALVAYGAYSGVMLLGTASTGTAIGTLTGAAATNATLAWLGGGSIAAGGGGVAAGTLALGALAAGPALAVAGFYMSSKAKENLENARSNIAQARQFRDAAQTSITLLDGIHEVTVSVLEVLSEMSKQSRRQLKALQKVFEEQGYDYSLYDNKAKETVMKNIKVTQVMKTIIDTAILDEDGNLLNDAKSNILQLTEYVNNDLTGQLPSA